MGNAINRALNPDTFPAANCVTTFDPLLGAPNRKLRTVNATEEEMYAAKIPLADRDYCVDKLLAYRGCYNREFPWIVKCSHERHAYEHCEYEDYVLRMKEFERERRLLERQKRIGAVA